MSIKSQNDNVDLKNIKLFRVISKEKFFSFFQKFWGAKAPLVLLIIRHCGLLYCYIVITTGHV